MTGIRFVNRLRTVPNVSMAAARWWGGGTACISTIG